VFYLFRQRCRSSPTEQLSSYFTPVPLNCLGALPHDLTPSPSDHLHHTAATSRGAEGCRGISAALSLRRCNLSVCHDYGAHGPCFLRYAFLPYFVDAPDNSATLMDAIRDASARWLQYGRAKGKVRSILAPNRNLPYLRMCLISAPTA